MMKNVLAKGVRGAVAIGLCASLAACVTTRATAPVDLGVLATALTEPVEALRREADAGRARAQYAMAVLHTYGVRGVAHDQDQATVLRRKALAARGYTPITTYIAGLHGKPGRVATINTPRYELNAVQVWRIDQCAAALAGGEESQPAVDACAGPAQFARLKVLWAEAKSTN
jgi:TPR repeat protein